MNDSPLFARYDPENGNTNKPNKYRVLCTPICVLSLLLILYVVQYSYVDDEWVRGVQCTTGAEKSYITISGGISSQKVCVGLSCTFQQYAMTIFVIVVDVARVMTLSTAIIGMACTTTVTAIDLFAQQRARLHDRYSNASKIGHAAISTCVVISVLSTIVEALTYLSIYNHISGDNPGAFVVLTFSYYIILISGIVPFVIICQFRIQRWRVAAPNDLESDLAALN